MRRTGGLVTTAAARLCVPDASAKIEPYDSKWQEEYRPHGPIPAGDITEREALNSGTKVNGTINDTHSGRSSLFTAEVHGRRS